jgi:rare lipoprotein A
MRLQILWQPRAAGCAARPGRLFAGVLAGALFGPLSVDVEAKTPGQTYCFNGTCHRVKTIAETERMVGRTERVLTSFYDRCGKDRYNPCGLTSSGEVFRADRPDNAASPIYPNGTRLLVWHPGNRRTLVVRVNNAGPYWGNRKLDLSRAAAQRLGVSGVTSLQVKVLAAPTRAEATYQKHRTYAAVPGYVGVFQSIESAFSEFGRAVGSLFSTPAVASTAKPARAEPAAVTVAKVAPPPAKAVARRQAVIAAKPAPAAVRTAAVQHATRAAGALRPSAAHLNGAGPKPPAAEAKRPGGGRLPRV